MADLQVEDRRLLSTMPLKVRLMWLGRFQWHPDYVGLSHLEVRQLLLEKCVEDQTMANGLLDEDFDIIGAEEAFWSRFVGLKWDQVDRNLGMAPDSSVRNWTTIDPETMVMRCLRYSSLCDLEGTLHSVDEYLDRSLAYQGSSTLSRFKTAFSKNTGKGWKQSGESQARQTKRDRDAFREGQRYGLL